MTTVTRLFRHHHQRQRHCCHFSVGGWIVTGTSNNNNSRSWLNSPPHPHPPAARGSSGPTRKFTSVDVDHSSTRSRSPSIDSTDDDGSSNTPPNTNTIVRPDIEYVQKHYRVRRRGQNGYGTREYLLVPPDVTNDDLDASVSLLSLSKQHPPPKNINTRSLLPQPLVAAAIIGHRNILFGARAYMGYDIVQVGIPLVTVALHDACEKGEQPQAIASLNGLSSWVESCLHNNNNNNGDENNNTTTTITSTRMDETVATTTTTTETTNSSKNSSQVLVQLEHNDMVAYEAVKAIATGIPRPGHSVVGAGTFRDGEAGWKALAKEYIDLGLATEVNLYQTMGGRVVSIEHLADTNADYLDSAGGAMARLFFL
jgi:hypothetical protein